MRKPSTHTHTLLCVERQLPFNFNNTLLSFTEIKSDFQKQYSVSDGGFTFEQDHVVACTFSDGAKQDHLHLAAISALKSHPNAMVFEGYWGAGPNKGRAYKILIDCGSSIECIVNTAHISVPASKLKKATLEPHRIRTGGGIIETNARTWTNQHVFVGNSSVSVSKVTELSISALDYDMILGYPFLTRHNPAPNWRTGALSFPKFVWHPVAKSYTDVKAQLSALQLTPKQLVNELKLADKDPDDDTLFVLASMSELLDHDTARSRGDVFVPGVRDTDQSKVLSQDLENEQREQLGEVIKNHSKGSLFTQKDNLPHDQSPLWGDGAHRSQFEMNIEVDESAEPPSVKSRQMSPKEKAEMKRQLMWMLTHGFVKPSTSRYSSPVLFVKKGDGGLRFCVDYRAINLITKTEKFPVPRIDELIDKLSKSRYYSAIDACQGYHQFGVTKNAQKFTAFECPYGRFEYCRIPFGLKNAVSHYQRVMSSLVGEGTDHASYVCNLLDDVLIFSETFEDHLKHVDAVLTVMEQAKIFLNLSKCTFGFAELKWMGHILGRGERKPSPEKVKVVQEYPDPETVTEVRSLLGVITYLGEYIPNLQKLLAPFKEIRNGAKNAKVQLNEQQREGWDEIKKILTSGTILKLPDFDRKFFLQTDASEFALGCCLLQPYDGKLFPVEYYSRTLSGAQLNYAIYDKELLAMQEGMKKFRAYLQHDEFVLLTDHKPLTHLRTQLTINLRQMRFLEFDAEFDYKIVYIKGEDNIFADFLSRPPGTGIDKSKLSPSLVKDCSLCRQQETENMYQDFEKRPTEYLAPPTNAIYDHTCGPTKPVTQADINDWASGKAKEEYVASLFADKPNGPSPRKKPRHSDTVHSCVNFSTWESTLAPLSKIEGVENFSKKKITDGHADDPLAKEILKELKSPHNDHHYNRKYQELNGLLYLVHSQPQHGLVPQRGRVYIPDSGDLRTEIIKFFHDNVTCAHRDADGTYMHVAENYYFPNMYKAIRLVVKNCEDCQRTKYITKSMSGLHQPLEAPAPQPWQNIATDFCCGLVESIDTVSKETYNKIQIYVDRLSREVVLVPGHNTDSAVTTARRYRDRVFPFKGLPESIVSDRDPLFTSEFWGSMSDIFNTRLKMSSAHHPQTDGLSERMVGVLTTMISIFVNYRQNDWADYLGLLQFALNRHTVKNRDNLTPFLISQGYNPFGPTDFTLPAKVTQQGSGETIDFHKRQQAAAQAAHDAIVAGQDVVARRTNRSRTRVTYQPGDKLYLKKDHIFPPGERDKPSHKLRQRWMGPYTVIRRVGELAVELDIKGDKLLNHPVFHVESTKPCPAGTVLEKAERLGASADGDEWVVESIDNFRYHFGKPQWLVNWGGMQIEGTTTYSARTWQTIDDFVIPNSTDYISKLVEFERKRTGLSDTLDTGWNYPNKTPGRTHKFNDGWSVYFTRKNQTILEVAKFLKVTVKDLYEQNIMAYAIGDDRAGQPIGKGKLANKRKLPRGEQLRVPKR